MLSIFIGGDISSPYGLLEYADNMLARSFGLSKASRACECAGSLSFVITVSCDDLFTTSVAEPFE